jgi:hypothetical protein
VHVHRLISEDAGGHRNFAHVTIAQVCFPPIAVIGQLSASPNSGCRLRVGNTAVVRTRRREVGGAAVRQDLVMCTVAP